MAKQEGCVCQGCGNYYQVDLVIPNEVWESIKPEGKAEGAGLLCGSCIMARVEAMSSYAAWDLVKL